jgi:hypothetical protein
MPRIKCHYIDCAFIDDGYCSAAAVEIDPDSGCLTFSPSVITEDDEDWDQEDDLEEWDEVEDDDDELWVDDEEDEF